MLDFLSVLLYIQQFSDTMSEKASSEAGCRIASGCVLINCVVAKHLENLIFKAQNQNSVLFYLKFFDTININLCEESHFRENNCLIITVSSYFLIIYFHGRSLPNQPFCSQYVFSTGEEPHPFFCLIPLMLNMNLVLIPTCGYFVMLNFRASFVVALSIFSFFDALTPSQFIA